MAKRFITIWFQQLRADWFTLRQPALKTIPFVLASPDHGRMVITATNALARAEDIHTGMVVADARAILPSLHVIDDKPGLSETLLTRIAEWFIQYTPSVAVDRPEGIIADATGCAHLWGGEEKYLQAIENRLYHLGYHTRAAMADTIGAAWAMSRYGKEDRIISKGTQGKALLDLPVESLRIETETVERLQKLGLHQVKDIIGMPRSVLRRRFGPLFIKRLNQAMGHEEEIIQPLQPVAPYEERLPSLEPIVTATGIKIALERLLEALCTRLQSDQKGLRTVTFKCYRTDGKIEDVTIGTNRPSHRQAHLIKLFENKLPSIEPGPGIELFLLVASKTEEHHPSQESIWAKEKGWEDEDLSELLDRLAGKIGTKHVRRYQPDEHYWPERSIKPADSLSNELVNTWSIDRPRPLQLLPSPEPVDVTAPIPDYPPMHFRYKKKLHKVVRADGPERIEQEWWLQEGQHRDYYYVEDEEGHRYWLFRLGHYSDKSYQWFIHGFFS